MKAVDLSCSWRPSSPMPDSFSGSQERFVIRLSEPVKVKLTGGYCPLRSYYIFLLCSRFLGAAQPLPGPPASLLRGSCKHPQIHARPRKPAEGLIIFLILDIFALEIIRAECLHLSCLRRLIPFRIRQPFLCTRRLSAFFGVPHSFCPGQNSHTRLLQNS